MDMYMYLVVFITLVLAAAFFYIWRRRDVGKTTLDDRA